MVSYRNKKVLVVDDFPEFRMSIRQMLLSLKLSDIQLASNGEDALRVCQKHSFDIILCDYNLGEGKDGQQLLEELRARKLLKHRSMFIMLTAENTSFMVMGAIENSPDAYITKPFNRQDLMARLDRLTVFKDEMEDVDTALDDGHIEKAIKACDDLIQLKSKISSHAIRVKASLLFESGRAQDAMTIYEEVLKSRDILWAQYGQAKVLFQKEEYERLVPILRKIIIKNQYFIEAFDLLGECYAAMGDVEQAQKTLSQAISKSAKSPARQHRLAEFARQNNDIDTAARAMRRTVELSQNGIHESTENVLEYVEVLRDKASLGGESLASKRACSDALNVLSKFKKEIRKDANAHVYSKILESKIYEVSGKHNEANRVAKEAKILHETVAQNIGPDVLAELANTMLEIGEFQDAASLLAELDTMDASKAKDPEKVEAIRAEMRENDELREFHDSLNPFNQKGVELYDSNLLEEAIDQFRKAIEFTEASITVNLNLAQGLLKLLTLSNKLNEDLLDEVQDCFDRIGEIEHNNPRFGRYQELSRLHQKLIDSIK